MEKICIVLNKPMKRVEDVIAKINPEIQVTYSCIVYDLNHQSLRIRKHDDGELYMFGENIRKGGSDYIDCHTAHTSIPKDQYIYMYRHPMIDSSIRLQDFDTVIAMPFAGDFESYLAISMFLKNKNYDVSRKTRCLEIDGISKIEEQLVKFLSEDNEPLYFETKFAELYFEREKKGFVSSFPMSRDIRYLQTESRMNNIEFAEFFNTSVRNVENWRKEPESLKDYIYDLFEYKLLKEGII